MDKFLAIVLWTPYVICALCLLVMGSLHIAGGYTDFIERLADVLGFSFCIGVGFLLVAAMSMRGE